MRANTTTQGQHMTTSIEINERINEKTVEEAYRRAIMLKRDWNRNRHVAEAGMRAGRARDPKLLAVLERAAEILYRMNEEQLGQTQRDVTRPISERITPQEAKVWQEAYRTVDNGTPISEFAWIYGAAGQLAGIIY